MILFDAHTHIYDCYNLNTAFQAAANNLLQTVPSSNAPTLACCLTERPECRFFQSLEKRYPDFSNHWKTELYVDSLSHRLIRRQDNTQLLFFAGHQYNTAERLEVAALFCRADIPDKRPIRETIQHILDHHGLPTLNWAFGKWVAKRGKIIQDLLNEFAGRIILCDSSMRPCGWFLPDAITPSANPEIPLLAGTDPLPCQGEEQYIGTYGTRIDTTFPSETPAAHLKQLITNPGTPKATIGRRNSWATALKRQINYHRTGCSS